jgi:hypothetical protein
MCVPVISHDDTLVEVGDGTIYSSNNTTASGIRS